MTAYAAQTAGVEVETVDLIWSSGLMQLHELAEGEWNLTSKPFDADLTYTFVITGQMADEGLSCSVSVGRSFKPEHQTTDLLIDAIYVLVRSLVDPIAPDAPQQTQLGPP